MSTGMEHLCENDIATFKERLADLERRIAPDAQPRKDGFYRELHAAWQDSCRACREIEAQLDGEPDELKQAKQSFREQICQWLDQSWILNRARVKPRGYPGDYAMLVGIYDNIPKGRGFGGYLDLFGLNMTLARGVRERMLGARQFLHDEMARREGDISVLNIACGPFREYSAGIYVPKHCRLNVTCIDYDEEALDYVRALTAECGPDSPHVTCVRHNALRMSSARANVEKFGRADVIYSVGLFDYLPDKHLIPLLAGLRESVNEDGVVYAAFKDCRRYDKTEYQWHLDWYFYQRTEEECADLFAQAGYNMSALEVTRDCTGAILSFVGRAKPARILRTDLAQKPQTALPERIAASNGHNGNGHNGNGHTGNGHAGNGHAVANGQAAPR